MVQYDKIMAKGTVFKAVERGFGAELLAKHRCLLIMATR